MLPASCGYLLSSMVVETTYSLSNVGLCSGVELLAALSPEED